MSYLLINKQTRLIENVVAWDGDTTKWQPPETYNIMQSGEIHQKIAWEWNEEINDWGSMDSIGTGNIGETWDGTKFIQPKPLFNPAFELTQAP